MPLPPALALLQRGATLIGDQFGNTEFVIEGLGTVPNGNWNDLGRSETLELAGRRISFSVMVEFPRAVFAETPLADLLKLAGKLVTLSSNGEIFRIVGEVHVDELTIKFPLASRNG